VLVLGAEGKLRAIIFQKKIREEVALPLIIFITY